MNKAGNEDFDALIDRQMQALRDLAKLADMGSGGSRTAATVLLHAWNSGDFPIHNLRALSGTYAEAAALVIRGIFEHGFLGGDEIERQVGSETIRRFAKEHGPKKRQR